MRKSPCVAGVNGGFFSADAEGTPLGLVVQDGKRLSPLATGSFAVSGVVYEGGRDGLTLIRSSVLRRMRRLPAMQAAIQGGPFLVENGSAVKGLNAQKSTYRTFIATDGGRRWCIGVSSSLTLMEAGGARLRLFDCDAEAGRLLDGGTLKAPLSSVFGPASVDSSGKADRHFLRELVFRNPESRRTLEGIIHPLLHQECLAQMLAARQNTEVDGFVIDVPLFFETSARYCQDAVCVVAVSRGTQKTRLAGSG